MKKYLEFVTAFASVLAINSVLSVSGVNAEDFKLPELNSLPIEAVQEEIDSEIPYVICDENENDMKKAGNPDLYELAEKCGMKTDMLNILNFKPNVMEDYCVRSFRRFLDYAQNTEAVRNPSFMFSQTVNQGICYGITTIEVLAHNGVISPSDIQEGANNLSDLKETPDVLEKIVDYHVTQNHNEQAIYIHSKIANTPVSQQRKEFLSLAERCRTQNRYYLINIFSEESSHAVTGIGLADGSWMFNGKNYDKCILTLDSNVKDSSGNFVGFSPETCIYLNSETQELYIPNSKIQDFSKVFIYATDDDEILNFKGSINGSEKFGGDIENVRQIELNGVADVDYKITTFDSKGNPNPFDLKNAVGFLRLATQIYYPKGSRLQVEAKVTNDERENYSVVVVDEKWYLSFATLNKDAVIDIDDNYYQITSKNGDQLDYDFLAFYNEGNYNFSPYYAWVFSGETHKNLDVELAESGYILHGDKGIKSEIQVYGAKFNDDGTVETILTEPTYIKVNAVKDVYVKVDSDQKISLLLDRNNDGIYDIPVEKGDANCDGKIDAVDASVVLESYANRSAGKYDYVDVSNGDMNNDGSVDAIDASNILTIYANASTRL